MVWLGERERAEPALRLAGALKRFWYLRGRYGEGRAHLEAALALPGEVDLSIRAKALAGACELADWQGDYALAVALGEEAVTIWRALGDRRGLANACWPRVSP